MILVYTGKGKGKTSAALGQVIRALGNGLGTACVQFMKRDGVAGEQVMLKKLLGDDYLAGGLGFYKSPQDFQRHRAASLEALGWAVGRLESGIRLCVMDESLYALNQGLILRAEMEALLDLAARREAHLVLTGRHAPDWLVDRADVVTEMVSRKHHFALGWTAVPGVEF